MSIDADLLARVRGRAETLVDDQENPTPVPLAIIEAMKAEGLNPSWNIWGEIFVNLRRTLLHGDPLAIEDVSEDKVCEAMEAIFWRHPDIGFRSACRELMRQLNIVGDFNEVVHTVMGYRKRERAATIITPPRSEPQSEAVGMDPHGESSEPKPRRRKAKGPPDPQGRLGLVFPPEDKGNRTGGASS